jgi:hypothetical protein
VLPPGFVRGNGEAADVRNGVVVGHSRLSTPDREERAFAWTRRNGKVELGTLPGDNVKSDPVAQKVIRKESALGQAAGSNMTR